MPTEEDRHVKSAPIDRNRELLKSAREEIYKSVGDVNLSAFLWTPEAEKIRLIR